MERSKFGKTRSTQEKNLRSEGYRSMSDNQLDRCQHLEGRLKKTYGSDDNSVSISDIDDSIKHDEAAKNSYNLKGLVERRDQEGRIVSMALSKKGRENFDKINWHRGE